MSSKAANPRTILPAPDGKVLAVAFCPDGKTLACGYGKGLLDPWGELRLWDPTSDKARLTLSGHTGGVTCLAFAADGRTLASGSHDSTVRLWDPATGALRTTTKSKGPVPSSIHSVALTREGKVLALGDGILHLQDAATGAERATFIWMDPGVEHRDWISSLAFSPDDRMLASASWDGTVKVWDVSHVKEPGPPDNALARLRRERQWDDQAATLRFTLKKPVAWSWSVAFAPDGKSLAAGYHDGTVRLWDTSTGEERAVLRQGAAVRSVAFAADGRTLAAGCEDGAVRVWDVDSRKQRAALRHAAPVSSVAFSPDGRTLASGGGSEVRLWSVLPKFT